MRSTGGSLALDASDTAGPARASRDHPAGDPRRRPLARPLLDRFQREFASETPGAAALGCPADRTVGPRARYLSGHGTFALIAGRDADGMAIVRLRPSLYAPALEAYLAELYVVPEQRGQRARASSAACRDGGRSSGRCRPDRTRYQRDRSGRPGAVRSEGFINTEDGPHGPIMYVYERELLIAVPADAGRARERPRVASLGCRARPAIEHGTGPAGPGSRRTLLLRVGLLVVLLGAVAMAIADLIPGSTQRLDHIAGSWLAARSSPRRWPARRTPICSTRSSRPGRGGSRRCAAPRWVSRSWPPSSSCPRVSAVRRCGSGRCCAAACPLARSSSAASCTPPCSTRRSPPPRRCSGSR